MFLASGDGHDAHKGIDFSQHLNQMIAFIDQEGEERAMEIHLKSDEEINSLVGNMVNSERVKINNYYTKQECIIDKQRITRLSLMVNEERLKVMKMKVEKIQEVFEEVNERLMAQISDSEFYEELLRRLILQALCMVMERYVGLRVRRRDASLVKRILPGIREEFETMSQIRVRFELDERVFLDDSVLGGVEMFTQAGAIKVENTLKSRMALVGEMVMYFIRYALFGLNPHRGFYV